MRGALGNHLQQLVFQLYERLLESKAEPQFATMEAEVALVDTIVGICKPRSVAIQITKEDAQNWKASALCSLNVWHSETPVCQKFIEFEAWHQTVEEAFDGLISVASKRKGRRPADDFS